MKIVLFSRVPRWYSFKNERLARRLTADGHEIVGVIVEQTATIQSLLEWKSKLGADVFLKKAGKKILGAKSAQKVGNNGNRNGNLPEVSPKVFFVASHNSPECVEILQNLEPDLIVLRGCGIIKKHILEIPKIGVINPHYAKLPDFRGMDVTEWSVLCGADVAVSVHTVNEGVDTGVVLKSKIIEPTSEDTVGSLRDKSAALVVDLLAEAVKDFSDGKPFPSVETKEAGGKQYFQMHPRLKELANLRLKKFGRN
ncbi:MAG TPA: formyl transferase [Pyrinomonadaceae bacterium]|jgi:methionyl-tRNA formyltransferase